MNLRDLYSSKSNRAFIPFTQSQWHSYQQLRQVSWSLNKGAFQIKRFSQVASFIE